MLDEGGVPRLRELTLHNGTIYRWNRPVYEVVDGVPHLRVENRVMPAGPTVADVIANAAFYYGLVRALAEAPRPVWHRLPFAAAAANFDAACRDGIGAVLHWPRPRGTGPRRGPRGRPGPRRAAAAGRRRAGLPGASSPSTGTCYLGIIEERCRRRTNGAEWQAAAFHRLLERGLDRRAALAAMTQRYRSHCCAGRPGAHLAGPVAPLLPLHRAAVPVLVPVLVRHAAAA